MTKKEIREEIRSLNSEEKELLEKTRLLREQRELLGKEFYAIKKNRDKLTDQINAIHQPRLSELKKRKSALAKAMMALQALETG